MPIEKKRLFFFENVTKWIGSTSSVIAHTIAFIGSFLVSYLHYVPWTTMLLVVTTVVSLEAIYLAIFIQMSVNQQAISLREVEEDVGDLQENVEDISEDVGEIQEDIEEITEDVEGIQEDVEEMSEEDKAEEEREKQHLITLEELTKDVRRVLEDLEKYKKQ